MASPGGRHLCICAILRHTSGRANSPSFTPSGLAHPLFPPPDSALQFCPGEEQDQLSQVLEVVRGEGWGGITTAPMPGQWQCQLTCTPTIRVSSVLPIIQAGPALLGVAAVEGAAIAFPCSCPCRQLSRLPEVMAVWPSPLGLYHSTADV